MKNDFPDIVSYNRFLELSQKVSMPMTLFLKTCCLDQSIGISFVDSTPIRVCKNKRIYGNKVFKGMQLQANQQWVGFMELKDKILLRKRSVIETVNDELKNMCQIEHSRHRSFNGFIANTIAALIAYSFFPKKPSIKFDEEFTTQVALF